MRAVDRIIQSRKERKNRLDAARAAVDALSKDEREELVAELIDRVEADAGEVDKRAVRAVRAVPKTRRNGRWARGMARPPANGKAATKTDRAEALVFAHPDGITALEVGGQIGQSARTAESTLRQVLKRGTIERRRGKWYPVGKPSDPGRKLTNRAAITEVLAGGKALGTADIFRAVQKLLPKTVKPSIAAEIQRMKTKGVVVERGRGARGALYELSTGGASAAAVN